MKIGTYLPPTRSRLVPQGGKPGFCGFCDDASQECLSDLRRGRVSTRSCCVAQCRRLGEATERRGHPSGKREGNKESSLGRWPSTYAPRVRVAQEKRSLQRSLLHAEAISRAILARDERHAPSGRRGLYMRIFVSADGESDSMPISSASASLLGQEKPECRRRPTAAIHLYCRSLPAGATSGLWK